ncbi:MAG TPA: SDR family oxidoreductase [Longimicrobium sp.]|jgi:NAD(P)-dependent dehydrogenase (short-subunit alcohol dehydrogenase family)|uniref:SDR family oxidoreductase n=1 Tax=Longimicrobium sp. TaxID=2029185 RepID=UPI002ED8C5D5
MAGQMEGRVCVVTGATAGIGQATAAALAKMGATVVLVARNADKAGATREEIVRSAGHARVETVIADLAIQSEVHAAAAEIRARNPAIHVLVNNAAIYTKTRQETADGMEMQLAVNHLAPFLLTHLLMDALRAGAPARVVTVSSEAHHRASFSWDDIQMRRKYGALRAYCNAKLFNILFTRELARRAAEVTANAMHPGVVGTALLFGGWAPLRLLKPFIRTAEEGARTAIYLASSPDVAGITGAYFKDEKPRYPSRAAQDDESARRLWQISAELTGLAANS